MLKIKITVEKYYVLYVHIKQDVPTGKYSKNYYFYKCVIAICGFSRCAHRFRWALRRAITTSLWISPDPGGRQPWQEAWTQLAWVLAWTAPISVALQWAWTSPGHQEWGRLEPTAKGYNSKDMQAPDLSPCQCRAQSGPILERWGSTLLLYLLLSDGQAVWPRPS